VFGTRGSYRCILIEQKPLTAAEFKTIAEDAHHAPPKPRRTGEEDMGKGARRAAGRGEGDGEQDPVLERPFWSSVTINPPLYGADTPQSFFAENLPYGWNLRHLGGCLLHKHDVPDIAGVTTPMTYFGMWKSFFSWHVVSGCVLGAARGGRGTVVLHGGRH
jgi:jumonji domain-containing protein 2